ncbi:MAG: diaminopimelate decarboxylase [Clostridia bacterium]|nr:diaminopimelate decarboxylase [Clostridia bacterium]
MIPYLKIAQTIPTPFYVFDESGFIDNYKRLCGAMKKVYPNYMLSYSFKTNYTPYICETVKELGGYAEVVSDMEYKLAKKIGYQNSQIVYNGPSKGPLLEEHLRNGGILNIDNLEEAKRVAEYAKEVRGTVKVGLRLNLNITDSFISRFGMEIGSEELEKTIKILKSADIKIVGLHCHISRNRGIEAWKKRSQIMIEAADRYLENTPEYISLGSGMFADMSEELKGQFSSVPSYEEYAVETLAPFAERYKDEKPLVFTEPGTTVVARYLNFVTSVLSIKKIRGRYMANMDGSYENLGEICTMKDLPIQNLTKKGGAIYDAIDIMGYTCLEQDMMRKAYKGSLAVGDVLVFENVGGYSIVSKPQFIKPNCRMVAYTQENKVKEIMREETFEDVFSKFSFKSNG